MVNLRAEAPSWFPPRYLQTWEVGSLFLSGYQQTQKTSWFPPGPLHTQEEESWFPPGPLHAQEEASEVACSIPALEHLPPVPQYYSSTDTLGGLLWVPLTCSLDLKFVTQAEPTSRGPALPTRPPTAQEVCYRRAQQAQRESASRLQAAQPLAEKQSSMHISAPGEKRRIAHVPNPLLAAGGSQGSGLGSASCPAGGSQGRAPFMPVVVALSRAWLCLGDYLSKGDKSLPAASGRLRQAWCGARRLWASVGFGVSSGAGRRESEGCLPPFLVCPPAPEVCL